MTDQISPIKPAPTMVPNAPYALGSQAFVDQYIYNNVEVKEIVEEMRRRYAALLQEEGTPCKLLQKKVSGHRCPYWSNQSQQCSKPLEHPRCFNTGWVGGYETPIDILVRFITPGMEEAWFENGKRVRREVKSWTLWKPLVKPLDVVVKSRTGEKFFLDNVATFPTWREDVIMVQDFNLIQVTSEPVRFFSKEDGLILE